MISLTRLTGAPFALNPDLVERVDCTPDTVITLVDGTKYLVGESLQEVSDIILSYRASIVAMAGSYSSADTSERRRSRLSAVPSESAETSHAGHDDAPTPTTPLTFEPRTV